MQRVADALWDAFHEQGIDWVGFYFADETRPENERLILGPRRDKPACSPIALHGVGGAAYKTGLTQIVKDVADLGDNYVECDPLDKSEIVIPLVNDDGGVWAMLDVDSHEVAAFDESDDEGLRAVLTAAGFMAPTPRSPA